MALFPQIYSRIHKRCENAGERLVLEQLRRCLGDDCIVWHDIPVGPLQRRPDFVIFNPSRGVLVLEVKHWKLSSIHGGSRTRVQLLLEGGITSCQHPQEQAYQCALQINNVLARDARLKQTEAPYQGQCAVPYGWGAVMSNVHQSQWQDTDAQALFPAERTLTRDDLGSTVAPEAFQERLWSLFTARFPTALTPPQQDRVRWHLFPEIRITHPSATPRAGVRTADQQAAQQAELFAIPDLMQVMDLNQEQTARTLGRGHRVIHGAAGSGKTMILVYRARYLAQQALGQPVLVLCYNRPLADRIAHQLAAHGVAPERVVVRTFHAWCEDMLRQHHIAPPACARRSPEYFQSLTEQVERALHTGQLPQGQYAALLIDEAHDFDAAWLRIAAQMVNPQTRSLLVLYDDAQSIYKPSQKRFSFASVGIEAKGRTSILRLNYRNTVEVLALAMQCANTLLTEVGESDAHMQRIRPASAGRRGPMPQLLRFANGRDEAQALAEHIAALVEAGTPPEDIAVLCRDKYNWAMLQTELSRRDIPWQTRGQRNSRGQNGNIDWGERSVKLLSMHASKGLEFPHVFLMRVDLMPGKHPLEEELRVLYVAMTRATERLTLSCAGDSDIVQRVQSALHAIADWDASEETAGPDEHHKIINQEKKFPPILAN
ncbi:3'-5' exonuclease [Allofranklinella schreckenbergeri]|nr:3'-5' exonuclease [Allofranklinella schreckenbergeri]